MKINIFQKINQKGFTLIELIVVVAIMTVISVIAMFNNSSLNSGVLLSNTAYEASLIIRDAQVSSLGARVLSLEDNNATTSNQGVYFNTLEPQSIIFFVDVNNNNEYDVSDKGQVYEINSRAGKILSICKTVNPNSVSDSVNVCHVVGSDSSGLENISDVNIIFKRPNPEAYFYDRDGEYIGSIVVNIGVEQGQCKSVIIYKTGATQVDNSYCPPNN